MLSQDAKFSVLVTASYMFNATNSDYIIYDYSFELSTISDPNTTTLRLHQILSRAAQNNSHHIEHHNNLCVGC